MRRRRRGTGKREAPGCAPLHLSRFLPCVRFVVGKRAILTAIRFCLEPARDSTSSTGSHAEHVRDGVRLLRHRRVHGGVPAERVQHAALSAVVERSVREAVHVGVPQGAHVIVRGSERTRRRRGAAKKTKDPSRAGALVTHALRKAKPFQ